MNESDHAYAGYEEIGTNIRVYDVWVFIYRFLISRAMVIMHESLRMIFMMTLQCTEVYWCCTNILVNDTYDINTVIVMHMTWLKVVLSHIYVG